MNCKRPRSELHILPTERNQGCTPYGRLAGGTLHLGLSVDERYAEPHILEGLVLRQITTETRCYVPCGTSSHPLPMPKCHGVACFANNAKPLPSIAQDIGVARVPKLQVMSSRSPKACVIVRAVKHNFL